MSLFKNYLERTTNKAMLKENCINELKEIAKIILRSDISLEDLFVFQVILKDIKTSLTTKEPKRELLEDFEFNEEVKEEANERQEEKEMKKTLVNTEKLIKPKKSPKAIKKYSDSDGIVMD